jgi:hypothetical protein
MKTLLRISLALGMALLLALSIPSWKASKQQSSSGLRFQVNAAGLPTGILFDYDFTQPLDKACSATVTTSCVSGFTFITQLNGIAMGTPINILLPATISATGPTLAIACANCIATLTSPGAYLFCLTTNYKDASGTVQSGAVACLAKSYPDAPVNLRTTP